MPAVRKRTMISTGYFIRQAAFIGFVLSKGKTNEYTAIGHKNMSKQLYLRRIGEALFRLILPDERSVPEMEIICLGLGLMILIAVNIVLGSLSAIFQNEFCPQKLKQGIIKAGIVAICFAATYLVGYLNPNIVAVEVNGVQVSVKTGIDLVVLVGYYHYAKQVIEKLTEIIKGNMFVSEVSLFKGYKKKNGEIPDMISDVTANQKDTRPDLTHDNRDLNMQIVVHLFIHENEEENIHRLLDSETGKEHVPLQYDTGPGEENDVLNAVSDVEDYPRPDDIENGDDQGQKDEP